MRRTISRPMGWREFMKWLAGFLDDKGAPTGSARFIATGATVVNRTRWFAVPLVQAEVFPNV